MKKKQLALAYEINNSCFEGYLKKIKNDIKNVGADDILIFSNDITNEKKEILNKIFPCTYIKTSKIRKAKFEIFKYLDQFKTIVFTSLNYEITNNIIKKYLNNQYSCMFYQNNRFVEFNFKILLNKYRMFEISQNTDFIIITDKLKNYKKIYNWCQKKSIIWYPFLRNRVNGVLDIMTQKFKINPVTIVENKDNNIENSLANKKIVKNNKLKFKTNGPMVTVLMSIYNRTSYIKEAINSILNQSYQNLEILIILEYSDNQDEIYNILKSFKSEKIKIIKNKEKLGLAESLNIGLMKAKGKYIARMDDDDISDPSRIEKQVEFLEKNKDVSIVGTFMKFFGASDLECQPATDYDILKVKCLYKTPLFHPTIMFRAKDLKSNNLFYKSNVYAEDYELWSRVIEKLKITNMPEVLYYYRLGNGNKSLQDERAINDSHQKIMNYQLKEYLDLSFDYDELQLLSGRIDVLGNCFHLKKVYNKKLNLWNKIEKANNKKNFYSKSALENEKIELKNYYEILKK